MQMILDSFLLRHDVSSLQNSYYTFEVGIIRIETKSASETERQKFKNVWSTAGYLDRCSTWYSAYWDSNEFSRSMYTEL